MKKKVNKYQDGTVLGATAGASTAGSDLLYSYPFRPDATYKNVNDQWLINLGEQTGNKFIPIDDPTGSRTEELNKNAVVLNPMLTQLTNNIYTQEFGNMGGIGLASVPTAGAMEGLAASVPTNYFDTYLTDLQGLENSIKSGYNPVNSKWFPHSSVEGGNKTLAYGHKLTGDEIQQGYISMGSDKLYFNKGITEEQARKLEEHDVKKHQKIAKSKLDAKYGKGTYDKLNEGSKIILTDFVYNLGPEVFNPKSKKGFPKFIDALVKEDKEEMLKQYSRKAEGKPLKSRNTWTEGMINSLESGGRMAPKNIPTWNYPSPGTPIYRDTSEIPPNTYAEGTTMVVENPIEDTPKPKDKKPSSKMKNLSENTVEFWNVLSEKFNLSESDINSAFREGSSGRHGAGEAIDIKPKHTQVYNWLLNSKEGLELMVQYGMGIIDETDPVLKKKYKSTGDHFHIGTDPYYANISKQRLASFDEGIDEMRSYKELHQGHLVELDKLPQQQKQAIATLPKVVQFDLLDRMYNKILTNPKEIQKQIDVAVKKKNTYVDKLETTLPAPKGTPRFGQGHLFKQYGGMLYGGNNPYAYGGNIMQYGNPPSLNPEVLQLAIKQVASENSVGIDGIPDNQIISFEQIYPELRNAVKERYTAIITDQTKNQANVNSYGGNIYGAGDVMTGIGSGLYGLAEGALDTLTFGLTDNLTDKGYEAAFSKAADKGVKGIRDLANVAGAVGGAFINPAATGTAVGEASEGVAGALGKTGNKDLAKAGQFIGQAGNMAGQFINPGEAATGKLASGLQKFSENPYAQQGVGLMSQIPLNYSKFGGMINKYAYGSYLGGSGATSQTDPWSDIGTLQTKPAQTIDTGVSSGDLAPYAGGDSAGGAGIGSYAGAIGAGASGVANVIGIQSSGMSDEQKDAATTQAMRQTGDAVVSSMPGFGQIVGGVKSMVADPISAQLGTVDSENTVQSAEKHYDSGVEAVADSWVQPTHQHQMDSISAIINDEAGAWGDAAFSFLLPGVGPAVKAQLDYTNQGGKETSSAAMSGEDYLRYGGNIHQTTSGMTTIAPVTVSAPSTIANPYYKEQMKEYQRSLTNKPAKSITQKADAAMLAKYIAHRDKHFPNMIGLNINKLMYDPNTLDPNTGLPGTFLEYFDKPLKNIPAPITTPAPTKAPYQPIFRDPTGNPLPVEKYGRPEGDIDYTYAQWLDVEANTLAEQKRRADEEAQRQSNIKATETLSPQQLEEAKAMGLTPNEYLGGAAAKNIMFSGDAQYRMYGGNIHQKNPNMNVSTLGERMQEVEGTAVAVPSYVQKGKSYHYSPNINLDKRGTDIANVSPYSRTFGDVMYDVFHPRREPRVSYKFAGGGNMHQTNPNMGITLNYPERYGSEGNRMLPNGEFTAAYPPMYIGYNPMPGAPLTKAEENLEGNYYGLVTANQNIAPFMRNLDGQARSKKLAEGKAKGLSGEKLEDFAAYAYKTDPTYQDYDKALAKERAAMGYATGGNMFTNGGFGMNTMNEIPVTEFRAGGTHDQNPLGGIPQGRGANGLVNLVEEGELKIPDPRDPTGQQQFVVSAQKDMKITKELAEENDLPKRYVGKTVRDVADAILRKGSKRDGDAIEENSKRLEIYGLINAHETLTAQKEAEKQTDFNNKLASLGEEFPEYMQALHGGSMNMYGGNIHQIDPRMTMVSDNTRVISSHTPDLNIDHSTVPITFPRVSSMKRNTGQGSNTIPKVIPADKTRVTNLPRTDLPRTTEDILNDPNYGKINFFNYTGKFNSLGGNIHQTMPNMSVPNQIAPFATEGDYVNWLGTQSPSAAEADYTYRTGLAGTMGDLTNNETGPKEKADGSEVDIDPELTNTEDLYRKQSWGNLAAQAAPALVNLGMGLFSKPREFDLGRVSSPTLARTDIGQELRELGYEHASVADKVAAAGGSSGNYLSNMQNLANTLMKRRSATHAKKQEMDKQISNQEAALRARADAINVGQKSKEELLKAQGEAAKTQQLLTGISQIGQFARSMEADRLAADYNTLYSDKYKYHYLKPWEKAAENDKG